MAGAAVSEGTPAWAAPASDAPEPGASSASTSGEIVATGLFHGYRRGTGGRETGQEIVHDCSFTVAPGKLSVIIGPSGCGKSTLVRLLAGFERPRAGALTLDGVPITGPSRDRQVVFQETALFPWMTTYENLMYGPRARGDDGPAAHAAAERLLARVGLQGFRDTYPPQLSGGMQRRAELARALINDPKVMILDEPFRGLDALTKELMWDYCTRLFEESGRTHLFVTTDIDEAVFLADRILIMAHVPTRLRAVLEVDLPRPRQLADVLASDRANDIKAEALTLLHEEAMKAFVGGSQAAADFVAAYANRRPLR
jgi:NitT/TauT family transport system ATP-binding protein